MIQKPNYCQQSQEMHRRPSSSLGKMLKELQKKTRIEGQDRKQERTVPEIKLPLWISANHVDLCWSWWCVGQNMSMTVRWREWQGWNNFHWQSPTTGSPDPKYASELLKCCRCFSFLLFRTSKLVKCRHCFCFVCCTLIPSRNTSMVFNYDAIFHSTGYFAWNRLSLSEGIFYQKGCVVLCPKT